MVGIILSDEEIAATHEEVKHMLDDADDTYHTDSTYANLLARTSAYLTNIPRIPFIDRVGPLTRLLKIFTDGDVLAYGILSSNANFRETLYLKAGKMRDVYIDFDLPGVPELLDEVENVKHILDELDELNYHDSEESDNEHESEESDNESDHDEHSAEDNHFLCADSSGEEDILLEIPLSWSE